MSAGCSHVLIELRQVLENLTDPLALLQNVLHFFEHCAVYKLNGQGGVAPQHSIKQGLISVNCLLDVVLSV